ncbi:MAG TPA: S41 family peptidase [Candidatus Saccharimonadales bacterium]
MKTKSIPLGVAVSVGLLLIVSGFVAGNRWYDIVNFIDGQRGANEQLPDDLDYSEVEEVYDSLRSNFDGQLDIEKLIDGLKAGLVEATGDPYTVYLTQEESNEFLDSLNGTFTGIGAELGIDDDQLIVVAPLDGFPADKAGLRARDVVVKINGEDTIGIKVEEAVNKIRGPQGTEVTLTITRAGRTFDLTITREEITVPSVTSEIKNGLGYLRVSRFSEDTNQLARAAANQFRQSGVKGVILDLRNNGGGFLSGAVDLAGLWLDGDVVVQERRSEQVIDTLEAGHNAILNGIPTIVLVNEGSASASEIVAGALKDHGAARLVGVTTFGKGSVQELEKLKSGGTLKVTIARWYTPNGHNIDNQGIGPDIEVKPSNKNIEDGNDVQRARAEKELAN